MAAIYASAQGTAKQFYSTWALTQQALSGVYPAPFGSPIGPGLFGVGNGQFTLSTGIGFAASAVTTPNVVDFDEQTNAALVTDILANFALYSAPNGTLQKNGNAVTIAASSAIYSARSALVTAVPSATLQTIFTALNAGTATTAQMQQALAYLMTVLYTQGNLAIPAAAVTTGGATKGTVL
jgi:hypothetical protein